MKLRRAMAVAAATAVIAPLTLLSAPAAFAGDPVPPAPQTQPGGAGSTEPAAGTGTSETGGGSSPADTEAPGEPAAPDRDELPGKAGNPGEGKGGDGEPGESGEVRPLCEEYGIDKGLSTKVTGLPSAYVAGSGWDEFRLTVTNLTGGELDRLWYDVSVELGAAEVEYLGEAGWTDEFQWEGDTASFGGHAADVAVGEILTADLRVRVPAGFRSDESFVVGSALYQDDDATCLHNGHTYDFVVLPAGSTVPSQTPTPSASPSGTPSPSSSPTPTASPSSGPSGGTGQPTGTLAATGGDSALPVMGAAGAAAVVLGAGAVFAVRRREAGARV
ncbi:LPXTG cell wall anchor domain-containing protein [Streptomyces abyssomicinicus]|uniref:LPXTG cell wall anchor domain-containing protein n=1 Tax=Streptomyces abyssomicinicus TaxID=574929 RepID=UPI00124FEFA6|nr:LPXTG cell wall anchor domain-containing protein [Streptomyces abyssomicinicus]